VRSRLGLIGCHADDRLARHPPVTVMCGVAERQSCPVPAGGKTPIASGRRRTGRHQGGACLLILLALTARALAGTAPPIHKCKRSWLGVPAPNLRTPQDVANKLRRKRNFPLWWWHRHVSSFFSTPAKNVGVFGWTDYCSEACAVGEVLYAAPSRHQFYTVDKVLKDFSVNGEHPKLEGTRFVRIEMHGQARQETKLPPRAGDKVRLCGKLMWDGDGFLEIHPRTAEDTTFLPDSSQETH